MQREFVCCLFRCLHVFEALYFRPGQHKSNFVGKRIHVGESFHRESIARFENTLESRSKRKRLHIFMIRLGLPSTVIENATIRKRSLYLKRVSSK